jgi:hypothetical protein
MTSSPIAEAVEASPAGVADGVVEVVPSRQPEGHGLHFKVRMTGRLYRLDAARDPHMPRFWCFRISRCVSAGTVDATERPWYGGDRMTREELPAALAVIRAAPDDWLALPQHTDLRAWVLADRPVEALYPARALGPMRRAQTG